MNKLIPLLFAFLFVHASNAQISISNTKTAKHQKILGTSFFIIPPTDFTPATNFQGFQQVNAGASILVVEMPGDFSAITAGFNAEGLASQGMKLLKKDTVTVNGYPGLLLKVDQTAQGILFSKYILTYGSDKFTRMINGTFQKEHTTLDSAIYASMTTVLFDDNIVVDPLESAPFTVNTDSTKLKFGKNLSGTFLYTVDGHVPTKADDKTSFIVGQSLSKPDINNTKTMSVNRLKAIPYNDIKTDPRNIKPITIDGLSGYEIKGEGFDQAKGKKVVLYQVTLFTESGYFIMLGTAKSDFAKNIKLFKQVATSFKRK